MPRMPTKNDTPLETAIKKIADLKEDIRRLSDKLGKKDSLLSSFMEVASSQFKRIASLTTTLHDTIPWDPAAGSRPSSCSTPSCQSLWAEVVVCGRKRALDGSNSPPQLSLSNHYATLCQRHPGPPGSGCSGTACGDCTC